MKAVALTTTDNPYNPLEDFDKWLTFDEQKGYQTCSYLDRIAKTSNQFTDEENFEEIENAIDEIVKYDLVSLETDGVVHYKKVVEDTD